MKSKKAIVMAAMALMILLASIPASASELAMLTGDSLRSSHGSLVQSSKKVRTVTVQEQMQKPIEYNKSIKDIFELPPQP